MPAASNGVLAGNAGWGCECRQHGYLLVAMGPDRRHPVKARAVRARLRRLAALTGWTGPAGARQAVKGLVGTSRSSCNACGTFGQRAIRDLFAASSSTVRSHEQKTSFLTLGTRLGPAISLVSAAFLCSAKKGLRPHQSHAELRAQAEVNDRANDREVVPKPSLTVASTVFFSGSEA